MLMLIGDTLIHTHERAWPCLAEWLKLIQVKAHCDGTATILDFITMHMYI